MRRARRIFQFVGIALAAAFLTALLLAVATEFFFAAARARHDLMVP